jgi:hypothetical protein
MYGQKRPFLREQVSDVNGADDLLRPVIPKARREFGLGCPNFADGIGTDAQSL